MSYVVVTLLHLADDQTWEQSCGKSVYTYHHGLLREDLLTHCCHRSVHGILLQHIHIAILALSLLGIPVTRV